MIKWYFTHLCTLFQSNYGESSHFLCLSKFPGFYQYKAWALKCNAQGHSKVRNQVIQCSLNIMTSSYAKIPKHGWLVVLGFNATLTAKVISWRSVMHMFPGFLSPVLTQLFFPKPPPTFPRCYCRGEKRKYAFKTWPNEYVLDPFFKL